MSSLFYLSPLLVEHCLLILTLPFPPYSSLHYHFYWISWWHNMPLPQGWNFLTFCCWDPSFCWTFLGYRICSYFSWTHSFFHSIVYWFLMFPNIIYWNFTPVYQNDCFRCLPLLFLEEPYFEYLCHGHAFLGGTYSMLTYPVLCTWLPAPGTYVLQ